VSPFIGASSGAIGRITSKHVKTGAVAGEEEERPIQTQPGRDSDTTVNVRFPEQTRDNMTNQIQQETFESDQCGDQQEAMDTEENGSGKFT